MSRKENYQEFQREIDERRIQHLIHFTPTLNLFSILEHGQLMSRAMLEDLDIQQYDILDYIQFTDEQRYDDKNYINLSISGPNTYLLKKFIAKTQNDMTIHWCVLKIDPIHICEVGTLFSVTNAASNAAKNQFGIFDDIQSFRKIFDDELRIRTRTSPRVLTRHNVAAKYPTDVQAEVLIKDTIPSSNIISVCFRSNEAMAQAKAAMMGMNTANFITEPDAFDPDRSR
jgi:hypothetical protein